MEVGFAMVAAGSSERKQMKKITTIAFDMDEVLVDLVGTVFEHHKLDRKQMEKQWEPGNWTPVFKDGTSFNTLFMESFGVKEDNNGKKIYNNDQKSLHKRHEIWESLPPTPWFKDLFSELRKDFHIQILSNAGHDQAAYSGKFAWIQKHCEPLGGIEGASFTLKPEHKADLLPHDAILIDDRSETIDVVKSKGKHGIVLPCLWNHRHEERHMMHQDIKKFINEVHQYQIK